MFNDGLHQDIADLNYSVRQLEANYCELLERYARLIVELGYREVEIHPHIELRKIKETK